MRKILLTLKSERMKARFREIYYSLYILKRNRLTYASSLFVLFLIFVAIIGPFVVPYPEDAFGAVHPEKAFRPPSFEHIFGTDDAGRDIFSRVIIGTRISLSVGVVVTLLTVLIGVPLGLIAGYMGGLVDEAIMRITDMFLSLPPLLLALVFAAVMGLRGQSFSNVLVAIAVAWWPWYTRLVRGQVVSLKERPFIEAAHAAGVGPLKIMFRHILPNCLTPILVQASLDFGSVILTAAGLSFLGLGAQPPTPEWGLMLSIGRYYFLNYWWLATFPGLAIFATVLAFNLMSDGLREALCPRLRRF
ncbi:MAG: ABC transporter permease [Candidatus Bathyarchaeia archaeon]